MKTKLINQIFGRFEIGDIIINPNVGLLCEVIDTSEVTGNLLVKPLVWKDYYRDHLARESWVNPIYFRLANKKDHADFQRRGILKGHPPRFDDERKLFKLKKHKGGIENG